jgi:hypothetical protein
MCVESQKLRNCSAEDEEENEDEKVQLRRSALGFVLAKLWW